MRVKTSVSLSSEILDQVGQYAPGGERSDFIEKALWQYLDYLRRHERNLSDIERINNASSFLNEEARDVLDYQVPL
jgi:metal-responsive CopG/Arc/MetJ family transcriptional regulator